MEQLEIVDRAADNLSTIKASPPIERNLCHSVAQLITTEFEWIIDQYELRGSKLESTEFSCGVMGFVSITKQSITWSLLLLDSGVLLQRHPTGGTKQGIRVKTAFLNARREKVFSTEIVLREDTVMPTMVNSTPRETLLDKSNDLIVDGRLTIFCQVETYTDETPKQSCQTPYDLSQQFRNKEDLLKDLGNLLEKKKHCDVTFDVRGHKIKAHKAILAARSPVFAAMFERSTKENLTGIIVDIDDIGPEVFKELLHYIYTGEVLSEQMNEVSRGLMTAADKYLLGKLKDTCWDYIVENIYPENCVLLLSLDENDPVREMAIDYVCQFPAEVMATDNWKKLNKVKPGWFVKVKDVLLDSLVLQPKAGSKFKWGSKCHNAQVLKESFYPWCMP